ncbi:MAG: BadF/BadG/BcrA/BcrD ATPase family protein [Halioglobus sp.]
MTCKQQPTPLYLGIDGGGSKCKARIQGLNVAGTGTAGPANPFQNLEQAKESIIDASLLALADAGLPKTMMSELVAGVGLAGVNVPKFMDLMQRWDHPFAKMYLTTDIHIACLSAHGGENGAVIVAGTGSVGYACIDGKSTSYGGHGFPFGDKGSGAWLGLEAIKAALLYLDHLGPETCLLQDIEQNLEVNGLDIAEAMAGARTRDYGSLAPLVLSAADSGDIVARGIIEDGAAYLSEMASRMLAAGADGFCLLGGLADNISRWMAPEVIEFLVEPKQEPDYGALLFAMTHYERASREEE